MYANVAIETTVLCYGTGFFRGLPGLLFTGSEATAEPVGVMLLLCSPGTAGMITGKVFFRGLPGLLFPGSCSEAAAPPVASELVSWALDAMSEDLVFKNDDAE